jgi:hypothetical protein
MLVVVALKTGIPMQYWDDWDDVATAVELIKEMNKDGGRTGGVR